MTSHPKTVIFWGAGSTATIGMRTSEAHAKFLRELAPNDDPDAPPVEARVRSGLGDDIDARWHNALTDLLRVLGDHEVGQARARSAETTLAQLEAMRRNWGCDDRQALVDRIVELRGWYDWPALVAAINICPRSVSSSGGTSSFDQDGFEIADLFNLLDMHEQSGHGFPVKDGKVLDPQRVRGARNALGLLLRTVFYVDWHAKARGHRDMQHHYDFAVALTVRMQQEGVRLASVRGRLLDDEAFVVGPLAIVSMNWDPIGLWVQFLANRDVNQSPSVPHVHSPARRLQVFHDLGHFVPGPRVRKSRDRAVVWQPMNASSARQLNDPDHDAAVRIRVGKYLFPHGCLWWRECPSCGKLSCFNGDSWDLRSETLLPPPPLRAFAEGIGFGSWLEALPNGGSSAEREHWNRGEVDARACVHCKAMTYALHTPLMMQSNFKAEPPPFIEEIQHEMRVVVQDSDHVVLMGYGVPQDDVTYRAFLSARIRRGGNADARPVRCSVVTLADGYGDEWLHDDDIDARPSSEVPDAVKTARALFRRENVRLYGGGVPSVIMDGDHVSDHAVDRLLDWESTSP